MKIILVAIFSICCYVSGAQQATGVGASTGNFPINKILNYSSPTTTFAQLKTKLLIIDFFGTWCVPCVKTLPHLRELQEQYKNKINIVLVSEETQDKLESFIKKQNSFSLPLVVDEDTKFFSLFQPPSYPYTVVIGTNNRVLAIPTQEEVTPSNIDKWLKNEEAPVIKIVIADNAKPIPVSAVVESSNNKLVQLSQEFVYAAKTGDQTATFIAQLQQISIDELKKTLQSDDEKKAFWINLYNAYTKKSILDKPVQCLYPGFFKKGS